MAVYMSTANKTTLLCIWHELYLTCEVALATAPPWRSTLTTLEWPLQDATIRGVIPSCDGVWRGLSPYKEQSHKMVIVGIF